MNAHLPILVVEDNAIDAMTVQTALDDLSVSNPVVRVAGGEEALEYLKNPDSTFPGLILLDLNMPRMDGLEFLEIIKNDQHLKWLPTVVLSTSKVYDDIKRSFELGAAGYIVKPIGYDEFLNLIRVVYSYWCNNQTP